MAEKQFDKVARYEAALRKIADMCPATQELTLAHQMAQEAEEALGEDHEGKIWDHYLKTWVPILP
jgi:hypothetical protein